MGAEDIASKCWAVSVSPCEGKLSREHYFPRGVFLGERVDLRGPLPGSLTAATRHINDLVTKCLCQKHNEETAPLDQALIDLTNSIRELEWLQRLRKGVKRRWAKYTRFHVDGPRIQRCVLKMVLNHSALQRQHLEGWQPPAWLADVVFGKRDLPEGCGTAALARIGDRLGGAENIGFGFGTNGNGVRDCGMLTFRSGWKIFCSWDKRIDEKSLVTFGDDVYTSRDILFPLRRVEYSDGRRSLGLTLDFDWSGRWSEQDNPRVVALRAKYAAPPRPGSGRRLSPR